jgi:MarR family transcriptional regulator, organic hydroperoxide resistance regulator
VKTDHVIALVSTISDRANRMIAKELRRRKVSGLAPSHGAILFELFQSGSIPMKEIARRINRDKSTVTVLVKKLAAHGYIETEKNPADSRVTLVRLTEKGRGLKPDFDAISRILLQQIYKGYSTRDKEILITGLERALKNLRTPE